MQKSDVKILVIYTGGTIGMVKDPKTGALNPFDFEHLSHHIPELTRFDFTIDSISFDPLIDSSNMTPQVWIQIAEEIEKNYEKYNGFVVLHGSDTMAYTASALSFMLEGLNKPVILTGSQLPLGVVRTDGKENFITALEIAATLKDGKAIVPEVCIYFEYQLYRGNRAHKFNAENFQAFRTVNYPILAEAGVHIRYNHSAILKADYSKQLIVHKNLDSNIVILKLYPGITEQSVKAILSAEGLKAVILETYGSGNAPTDKWFINAIKEATDKGIIIYNVTQCKGGSVDIGKYETSVDLGKIGVVGGYDITTESAVTKLMYLLGNYKDKDEICKYLSISLRGELTEE